MKFTIRDLFLVTLIVALAVGWWVDRSRLSGELWDYENIKMPKTGGMPGMSEMPLKEWWQEQKKKEKEWNEKTEAQQDQEVRELFEWEDRQINKATDLPNSSAPAPNPPKP